MLWDNGWCTHLPLHIVPFWAVYSRHVLSWRMIDNAEELTNGESQIWRLHVAVLIFPAHVAVEAAFALLFGILNAGGNNVLHEPAELQCIAELAADPKSSTGQLTHGRRFPELALDSEHEALAEGGFHVRRLRLVPSVVQQQHAPSEVRVLHIHWGCGRRKGPAPVGSVVLVLAIGVEDERERLQAALRHLRCFVVAGLATSDTLQSDLRRTKISLTHQRPRLLLRCSAVDRQGVPPPRTEKLRP
mmetsp:Transcript_31178/g.89089  ORF Transcript_31178/g.89089 Transcript_31178/m.89089 type:complete len:245 (-) Transcript_31178:8-742(-)